MPGFLVFFCLLTIFVVQLLCFHVPSPRLRLSDDKHTDYHFISGWMDLRYVHPLSVYDNYHPKLKKQYQLATFLSQTPLPSTTSDDDIQDRDAVRSQHWKWYSSYWTETKKKILEVNYENRLGDISRRPFHALLIIKSPGWGSRGTAVYEGSLRCGWHVAVKCFHKEPRYCSQSRNIHPSKITLTLSPIIIPNNPPIISILRSSCVRVHWLIFSKNCHGGGEKWDDITKRTMKQRASG